LQELIEGPITLWVEQSSELVAPRPGATAKKPNPDTTGNVEGFTYEALNLGSKQGKKFQPS